MNQKICLKFKKQNKFIFSSDQGHVLILKKQQPINKRHTAFNEF